ncbi:MAG: serine/threonine-protein kinase, partial [Thermoanaerobaculia bacterium]
AGSWIGRFQVHRVLGKGSMGVVYLATDPRIGRPIALKTFRPEGGPPEFSRDEMEDQFLREARLAGRLQHPNIVTAFDVGRARDVPFIVMEYVDGESLKALLAAHTRFTVPEALWIVRQIAEAVGHAHEKSVLHRDIKPGNVLVTREGAVKVTDFGVGKLLASVTSGHSRKGLILGSPAYMSPEQIREEKLDPRSDLFSLGVVTYELMTGSRPFGGESLASLAYKILNAQPTDPRAVRPDLPPAADEVFRRVLAKSREDRPADARAFIAEVERLGMGLERVESISPAAAQVIARLGREKEDALAQAVRASRPPSAGGGGAPRGRPAGLTLLFLAAAGALLLLAAAWLVSRKSRAGAGAETAAVATPAVSPQPALPTPGGAQAGSPLVGAPRMATPSDEALVQSSSDRQALGLPGAVERVYRTRETARFAVRPEQTRIWVNGRYVGVADDWDGWGGGTEFPFGRAGIHRVRLELPGHRTVELAVLRTDEAPRDSVKIEDRMERRAAIPYPKVPGLDARTRRLLELDVEPRHAVVSAGGRTLGRGATLATRALRLSGPAVHELQVAAPNHRPRVLRILVSPRLAEEKTRVKVKLKPS